MTFERLCIFGSMGAQHRHKNLIVHKPKMLTLAHWLFICRLTHLNGGCARGWITLLVGSFKG